jgi:hypothetical protein
MDIRELIPKHKFDEEVIIELKKLSFEQLRPIIPELLEWLQDWNWPIARPVADILIPFVDRLTPDILKILKTDDTMWKYWVLNVLVFDTNDALLLSEIERIAKNPTRGEIEDEVSSLAIEILNRKT